jgi:signal peptidase I
MHPTNLDLFLMVYVPLYIASHIGLFMLFRKAKVKHAWMAFFPVLCYWPWIQLAGRPKTWMIWALIPAADVIIWFSLVIDMMESFGKFKFWQQVAGVILPFIVYLQMGLDKKTIYLGPARDMSFRKKFITKKTIQREWSDAIFFAFVVAYIIRMFQLEPYKIPTSSMEDSMLVGDFLFVSKMNYGPRFPITPIAFPLVHQDLFGAKAYSDMIHLPYMRLPGFQDIKRNDPVVFNVPWDQLDPTERPVDKMQNYVKRCVAVPGDKLQIKNGVLYINDKPGYMPPKMLHNYYIRFKPNGTIPNEETLTKEYDIYDFMQIDDRTFSMTLSAEDLEKIRKDFEVDYYKQAISPPTGHLYAPSGREFNAVLKVKPGQKLSDKDLKTLGIVYFEPLSSNLENMLVMMDEAYIKPEKYAEVTKIDSIKGKWQLQSPGTNPFPDQMEIYPWNKDNYGPIYLPKRGEKVKIDKNNFYFYQRAIAIYEHNKDFELRGSTPYLNGQPITEYQFKMDYYWMMGDNRDNSLDSRFWGYVPEDHIVGKPLFVFFSIQYQNVWVSNSQQQQKFVKIRWNRLFKGIN